MDLQIIPAGQILRGEKLGEGGFGVVYEGTWNYHDVAVKALKMTTLNKELEEEFNREVQVMAKLNNPAIIRLYGISKSKEGYAMVLEYMSGGDLYHLLSNKEQKLPWQPLRWRLAIDIGSGLSYLHAHNILHRDLKSLNILLDGKLRAKITDFGLSKIKNTSSSLRTEKMAGSIQWMAPELSKRGAKLTTAADVYAYGMILWEIASRKIPFSDAPNPQIIPVWVAQGEREEIPDDCPKAFSNVIQLCWAGEPQKRPTAAEALKLLTKAGPQRIFKTTQPTSAPLQNIQTFPKKTEPSQSLSNINNAPETLTNTQSSPQITENASNAVPLIQHSSQPSTSSPYQTGLALYNKCRWSQALPYILQAAETGHPPAYLKLYKMWISSGRTGPKKPEEASQSKQQATKHIDWFKKQAATGVPQAQFDLARCYENGIGVTVDLDQSFKYYLLAANQGHAYAQSNLGWCYAYGQGVDKNFILAVKYYRLAADQGFALAQDNLGSKYKNGEGVEKDISKAIKYYILAAKQGCSNSQYNLGELYYRGTAVDKDYSQAVMYYQLAAKQGHEAAQYSLGWCYEKGEGVEKDFTKSVNYYRLAAHQKNEKAIKQLEQLGEPLISQEEAKAIYKIGLALFEKCQFKECLPYIKQAVDGKYPPAYLRIHELYTTSGLVGPIQTLSETWLKQVYASIGWYGDAVKKEDDELSVKAYDLAYCLQKGIGIPKDFASSVKIYQIAADNGYAPAQHKMGYLYHYGLKAKDFNVAVKYYRLAAKQGYALSQYGLGWCYQFGQGVEKDLDQAVKYYRLAADKGYSNAQFALGQCYEYGWGVGKDAKEAFNYYQKAENQGLVKAQYSVGLCYELGKGVTQNFYWALQSYRLAVDQRHLDAQYRIGLFYRYGKGVTKSPNTAVKCLNQAAERGSAAAQIAVGNWCRVGGEVKKDLKTAFKMFERAAAQKYPEGQFCLGWCYQTGEGVKRSMTKAIEYYKLAAEQGNQLAHTYLGICYLRGQRVQKDPVQAVSHFRLGGNSADALYNLGRCYEKGEGIEKDLEQAIAYYQKAQNQTGRLDGTKRAQEALKRLGKT